MYPNWQLMSAGVGVFVFTVCGFGAHVKNARDLESSGSAVPFAPRPPCPFQHKLLVFQLVFA
jgi:hypothetical protein